MRQSLKLISVNMLQRLAVTLLVCGCSMSLFAQESKVTGKITDESGAPLSGASVVVKGTSNGVVTDARGTYSITVSGNNATLEVSFLGYVGQDVAVGGRSVIDLSLAEDSQVLDEVVVTALGIKKDTRKVGYAVSSINAQELTKVGSPNFGAAMYGKASGVRIQSSTGGSSSAVSVTVRGISSLTGNTQPLLIVDGVPVRNGNANDNNTWDGGRIYGNGLVDINPEDIESLSILKGAAASALYGSEAANGVLLVTTIPTMRRNTAVSPR